MLFQMILKDFSESLYLPMFMATPPPIVATPYPWDYDLNKFESSHLHEDASTQVRYFLAI